MNEFGVLNDSNFLLFAAKNYHTPKCIDAEEFNNDLLRFKYIKKLLNKYYASGQLSERLLLNHFTVIFNVFGIKGGLMMLEYRIEEEQWPAVKPFLVYLRVITNDQYTHIRQDSIVVDALRNLNGNS